MSNMKAYLTLALTLAICAAVGNAAMALTWNVPGDFPTIQAAIDDAAVIEGHTILVGPGNHAGATVTKAVEIKGEDGAVVNSGPELGSYGLYCGFFFEGGGAGSGATISHLTFETVDFPVMSRGADDVTVEHCTMMNPIQGISNWGGSGWQISHNQVVDLRTRNGGGIGIIVADRYATPAGVKDNVVSHNKITGTLHVYAGDGGGYDGSGIVLYSDSRWGFPGAIEIAGNRVVKNKVSLTSDTPAVVDVHAIELTEANDAGDPDPTTGVIYDNAIGFNDLRGTASQLVLTPSSLDNPTNDISRNLGENRGHGLHPSAFGPGG